jgi:type II secretory ATPase GspE/PulE/Tfp pilus assembly ATPase PilB-like protein
VAEKLVDAVRWGECTGHLDEAAKRIADALDKGDADSLPGAPPKGSVPDHKKDIVPLKDAEPVVKLVNMIILDGIKAGATDIHIEPYAKEVKVRYRIDGVCVEKLSPPKKLHNAVVSRIKIMAQLDIAQRRAPQDGKIRMKMAGETIDFRVAVMPTIYGETVVMRILRHNAAMKQLETVVSVANDLEKVRAACERRGGLILVTGSPGSGKSTLLYSMVGEINRKTRSVISIEDPVEYVMDGVQQIAVDHKLGLTFALTLRCALRLDADVIVIGELRDTETAEIALKAATVGRLVLAVMHTPTPVDTVTRLIDMGLPAYELNAALAALVSQRLVRKLCEKCKAETTVAEEGMPTEAVDYLRTLKGSTLFSPVGCDECTGGYKGRAALQEILVPDEGFRRALSSGVDSVGLSEAALAAGMTTSLERGLELAAKGVTSVDEVLRVARDPRSLVG